jgi:hypothetical protein
MDSPFDEGWARVTFAQSTACADLDLNNITYTGAPIIPLVCELTVDGLSLMPMAYDYGTVTYNGVALGAGSYQRLAGSGGDVPAPPAPPAPVPTVPDCAGLTQADCNATDGCTWQAFPFAQCILDCAQFDTEAACNDAFGGAGCQWTSTPFGDVCVAK